MSLKPLAPYFIIKIEKQAQKDRREKDGMFYTSPSHIYMKRETQNGEIVAIGTDAHDTFPQAKVGQTLIIHHFNTGKEAEGTDDARYHIHSDETYNYYTVSCFSQNGRRNECYGVWDGETVVPHPEFVFLEDEKPIERLAADELHTKGVKQVGSLLLFNNWKETREEKGERMTRLKYEAQELARTTKLDENGKEYMPDEVKVAIEMKEAEMNQISKENNKREYIPIKLAWENELLSEEFGEEIKKGDTVYVLNQASNTKIEFNKITYRVVKIDHIACTEKWLRESVHKFNTLQER